jgi:tetratricopeptide (TPR) repeat protein
MNATIERSLKLLEQYPDNELARFSLGKAYYDLGQFALAKAQFALALARKPDWMAVRILAGKCDLSLGNRPAAIASFREARQLALAQNHEGPLAEMDELLAELSE